MLQLLHQYLVQNKSLSLPGLGTIQLQHIPAINNFTDHIIEPPSLKAILDDGVDTPAKQLFSFLSEKLGVEEWEAIKKLNDFSIDLKNALRQGGEIVWDRIGTFRCDADGTIQLEAVTISNSYMYPIMARRVIRADANHTILRGDTEVSESFFTESPVAAGKSRSNGQLVWVFVAVVLGLSLLFFYLYETGFSIYSIFNRQK